MNVTCPTCGEQGKLTKQLAGHKIKCRKCSTSFVAEAPGSASAPALDEPDGLDPSAWLVTAPAPAAAAAPATAEAPAAAAQASDAESPAFTAAPAEASPYDVEGAKQYKVLTQRDKWFEGRFELARLEEALNHYAKQGWVVRSMATPHVTGFSGGPREELVVLLER